MSQKAACILLTAIVAVAVMAVCVMVKFATDITIEEKRRDYQATSGLSNVAGSISVVAFNEKMTPISDRFPYVAAIARNSSRHWSFACFASIVLVKYLITSAHCRHKGATHRVVLLHDFTRNISISYPILYWRIHKKYKANNTSPVYDIAIAKFGMEIPVVRSSILHEGLATGVDACIWKTVAGMDRHVYLINDIDRYPMTLAAGNRCYESFGVQIDASLLCVDLSRFDDCFVHEFGPVFSGDKVVGVLALQPRDCEVKVAVFTNVSYYSSWVLKLMQPPFFG